MTSPYSIIIRPGNRHQQMMECLLLISASGRGGIEQSDAAISVFLLARVIRLSHAWCSRRHFVERVVKGDNKYIDRSKC